MRCKMSPEKASGDDSEGPVRQGLRDLDTFKPTVWWGDGWYGVRSQSPDHEDVWLWYWVGDEALPRNWSQV
jgi:hypothetical protein